MNEFSGYKKPIYQEWKNNPQTRQAEEYMNQNGEIIVNRRKHNFLNIIAVIFLLLLTVFGIIFGYLIYDGKLQSTIENTINPMFQANVTNNYVMPDTNNAYSISINITNVLPNNITIRSQNGSQ